MKQFAFFAAIVGLLVAPAFARDYGGISGVVTDLHTGRPMANVRVLLYRATGTRPGEYAVMYLHTDRRGFFSKMPLQQGRYVVMTRIPGFVDGCAIDDIIGGETARVHVRVGYDAITCSGPRNHPAMINPNGGGDLYIR
ncbi:MAG: carboxypeptidase-like regulatory domain-containing protein [Candidatus Tyrphobacter sp.]